MATLLSVRPTGEQVRDARSCCGANSTDLDSTQVLSSALLVDALEVTTAALKKRPFVIGVAGATASGKTTVVAEIVRLLDAEERVATLTADAHAGSTIGQRRLRATCLRLRHRRLL